MDKNTGPILIVENEPLIAFDIKEILESNNYNNVLTAATVDKAVELIEQTNPILVVIDIHLNQDKDGVDLGRYLLMKDEIPYIYLTSYTDKITLDRVNQTRPFGFVVKPFKPIDLITTISIVLNNFSYRNIDVKRDKFEIDSPVPFKIKATLAYIDEHINDKINIDELAEITPWKAHHFIRIFTTYIGRTPYQFILKRKIELAATLIIETNQPLGEIAYDMGFFSYSNFCIAFKKVYSQTPEVYRLKNKALLM